MARRYLMCRPTYFTVDYSINPWMDPTGPTDNGLAMRQWENLRETYVQLGHTIEEIDPLPGLPDMVFAANGATVVDGSVYGARFRFPQRAAEGPAYLEWFRRAGFQPHAATAINEGEGDFLLTDSAHGRLLLAGTGFRTDHAAHLEAQELFGVPVISLRLVDPRFYHLDTALTVLGDGNIAYLPEAFSVSSRRVLDQLFPDAVLAPFEDGLWLGLNAVGDGTNVVLPVQAAELASRLKERGYTPVPVDVSELLKAGGGPKCCTLEVRS